MNDRYELLAHQMGMSVEKLKNLEHGLANNYCQWYLGQNRSQEAELMSLMPSFLNWWEARCFKAVYQTTERLLGDQMPGLQEFRAILFCQMLSPEGMGVDLTTGELMVKKELPPQEVLEELVVELKHFRQFTKEVKSEGAK
jgi:hypothetical protein